MNSFASLVLVFATLVVGRAYKIDEEMKNAIRLGEIDWIEGNTRDHFKRFVEDAKVCFNGQCADGI